MNRTSCVYETMTSKVVYVLEDKQMQPGINRIKNKANL